MPSAIFGVKNRKFIHRLKSKSTVGYDTLIHRLVNRIVSGVFRPPDEVFPNTRETLPDPMYLSYPNRHQYCSLITAHRFHFLFFFSLYYTADISHVTHEHTIQFADYSRKADRRTDCFARLRSRMRRPRLLRQGTHPVRRLSEL